jgi:hypothetical protein
MLVVEAQEGNAAPASGPSDNGLKIGDNKIGLIRLNIPLNLPNGFWEPGEVAKTTPRGSPVVQLESLPVVKAKARDTPDRDAGTPVDACQMIIGLPRGIDHDLVFLAKVINHRLGAGGMTPALSAYPVEDLSHAIE